MSGHAGDTITLPEMVYEQIRQAAERSTGSRGCARRGGGSSGPVMDTPPGNRCVSALAHLALSQ